MSKTIAIVGAGPGLGLSIGKRFGAEGFQVALLARSQSRLDAMAAELGESEVHALAIATDVLDRDWLTNALARVESEFGSIDVLSYSPTTMSPPASVLDAKPENVMPLVEHQVLGAIGAVHAVLPAMRERGDGALLFVTGASSVNPIAMMGNVGIAMAGLRNYALGLHQALAPEGIYVGHLVIDLFIERGAGEADPDSLAGRLYELYEGGDRTELKIGDFTERATA